MQLLHIAEGLEHQQIDAAFHQSGNLFTKGIARFLKGSLAERLDANAKGTDRAGHKASEALGRLARQAGSGHINVADMAGQAVARQAKAVGAEGVSFNDLGARLQIVVMHGANEFRLGNVQLVIAPVDENALGVEQGSHGPVAEHWPLLQAFTKVLRHL